jgi:hypothetical protein
MNIQSTCQDMCTKLGFGCEQLEGEDRSWRWTRLWASMAAIRLSSTPNMWEADQIRFFDGGETLFHCFCRQISSFHLRDYQVVRAAIKQSGINVTHEGEIEGTFDVSSMASGFAGYIDALLSVARWEFDNAGTDFAVREPSLIHETRFYLNAMKPDVPVIKSAFKSTGVSGRDYGFHLSQGGTRRST